MTGGLDLVHVVCPGCAGANRVPRERLVERPRCGRCHEPLFRGHPLELGAETFDAHVGRSDLPVVVDFWAPWCGPCRGMAPHFEGAAAQLEPLVRLAKVNTEEEKRLAARYAIRSIPTMIAFRGGKEVARRSGALTGPALVAWIRQALGLG